jgi:hypothetical protein
MITRIGLLLERQPMRHRSALSGARESIIAGG